MANYSDESTYSTASGIDGLKYVVLQVTLKEKFLGTGSGNLSALESVLNEQAAKGYRLHTITTASATSSGFLGGDRIQATMVFVCCTSGNTNRFSNLCSRWGLSVLQVIILDILFYLTHKFRTLASHTCTSLSFLSEAVCFR